MNITQCYPQENQGVGVYIPFLVDMALTFERVVYKPTATTSAKYQLPVINIQTECGPYAANFKECLYDPDKGLLHPGQWLMRQPTEEDLKEEKMFEARDPYWEKQYHAAVQQRRQLERMQSVKKKPQSVPLVPPKVATTAPSRTPTRSNSLRSTDTQKLTSATAPALSKVKSLGSLRRDSKPEALVAPSSQSASSPPKSQLSPEVTTPTSPTPAPPTLPNANLPQVPFCRSVETRADLENLIVPVRPPTPPLSIPFINIDSQKSNSKPLDITTPMNSSVQTGKSIPPVSSGDMSNHTSPEREGSDPPQTVVAETTTEECRIEDRNTVTVPDDGQQRAELMNDMWGNYVPRLFSLRRDFGIDWEASQFIAETDNVSDESSQEDNLPPVLGRSTVTLLRDYDLKIFQQVMWTSGMYKECQGVKRMMVYEPYSTAGLLDKCISEVIEVKGTRTSIPKDDAIPQKSVGIVEAQRRENKEEGKLSGPVVRKTQQKCCTVQ